MIMADKSFSFAERKTFWCLQKALKVFSLKLVLGILFLLSFICIYHVSKHYLYAFPKPVKLIKLRSIASRPFDRTLLPTCPETPPTIHEPVKLNLTYVTPEELQTKYPSHPGDRYRPEGCRSRQRLAVVIPFRDRKEHLGILLNNLIPFLNKQQADFTIFVAEQVQGGVFNKGLVINAGVAAALKADNFTCLIIQDVDLIPEISENYYRCRKNPLHLASANGKSKYKMPYSTYVGGVVAITTSMYKRINGFSNLYFGWGGEDDDYGRRVEAIGVRMERNPIAIGRYYAQPHGKDPGNPINPKRWIQGWWRGGLCHCHWIQNSIFKIAD